MSQIWKRVQNTGKVGVPICVCTSKEQTPYALQISYIQLEDLETIGSFFYH